MEKVAAVIVAGGSGKRMGMNVKKQYILLREKEILAYTIQVFQDCDFVDEIVLVVAEEETAYVQEKIIARYRFNKIKTIAVAGAQRQDSVYNGLLALAADTTYVMIHDGARPFIKEETIYKCLEKAKKTGASIVAVPAKDTIKVCSKVSHKVEDTPDRNTLWAVQTPQIFSFKLLLEAYDYGTSNNLVVTDDSMIVEAFGKEVYITEGEYSNIKVTTQEDLIIAEAILKQRI